MEQNIINVFSDEKVCEYKGRRYYVRDNGAVYRQCQNDGKLRKWDEEWTFGKFDPNTGYMLIDQERVHRIVCTAYHGEPVGERNVADHIDTNRCNNRPENLRWVTKLENTLLNPITRAKIELICGSIEAFLENPSLLYGHESENPNFTWMRAVTKDESEHSLERWKEWAAKPIESARLKEKGKARENGSSPKKKWLKPVNGMETGRTVNTSPGTSRRLRLKKKPNAITKSSIALKIRLPRAQDSWTGKPPQNSYCVLKKAKNAHCMHIWTISSKEQSSQGRNMATEARFWMQDIIPQKMLSMFLPIRKTP